MAQQSLFDAIVGVDNNTYLSVQSILEAQSVQDGHPCQASSTSNQDEDDLFQCGKCKQQFSSLSVFVAHKQHPCGSQMTGNGGAIPNQQTVQIPQMYSQRPANENITTDSTYNQLPTNIVLPDDIMTLSLEASSANTGTLQLRPANGGHVNPFLSSVQLGSASQTPNNSQQAVLLGNYNANTVSLTPIQNPTQKSLQISSLNSVRPQNPVNSSVAEQQSVCNGSSADMVTLLVEDRESSTLQFSEPQVYPPPAQQINLKTALMLTQTKPASRPTAIVKSKKKPKSKLIAKQPLSCQFCRKTFMKQFDLQQHIRAHTGEKPFQCVVCGRGFSQKSNVKKHMQTHKVWPLGSQFPLPEQPPPQLMVVRENKTSNQNQRSSTNSSTQCKEKNSDDADDDIRSMRWHFIVDSAHICPYCPNAQTRFETYYQLKSHLVTHKTELVYKCVVKSCEETFPELDDFLEHTKMHESRSELTYRCHECNKQFPSLDALGAHQYTHFFNKDDGQRKKSESNWKCIECGSSYTSPEGLEHHMSTTSHSHLCQHCGKVYATPRLLRRHLASHKSEAEEFRCDICNKTMKSEHYLKAHKLIHTGELPFACNLCGKRFNRKDKVSRHMSVHDPVKKFVCPFKDITGCDKAFGRPDKLKEHVLKHTKINVDTVTSLPRSAHATSSSVVLLTKHAKSADGDSDKLCKHCKTCRFESKEELLTHEILCAQVPRLKCEKCDLTFNTDECFDQHQCKPIMETLKISQVNSIKVNHLKKRSMKRKKLNRIELSPPRVKTSRRSKRLPVDVEDESPSVQTPTKEVAAELTQNDINTVAN